MRKTLRYVYVAALLFRAWSAFAQVEVTEDLIADTEMKMFRQYSAFGQIHTNGFGAGFRLGNIRSTSKYNFQEFEFLKDKHPKAEKQRGMSWQGYPRRYVYGALNQLYVLRYGLGTQRTLNEKPYWGGLQVDYTISAGAILGVAIPQYLGILYQDSITAPPRVEVEKYDPEIHKNVEEINGGGPMFRGLFSRYVRPYPGIYGRFGLNFDFGKYQERVSALEVGMMIDVFPIPVPMMAFHEKNFFFANFYISYHFGKRK
ncbi:MAG: hypothetical protein LBU91_00920 [Bacteroidales bacterium]|jgi:hypothetical protein|nr:hypothetical protein [Bacteroidales bacterium]